MQRHLSRTVLALVLGLGVLAGLIRAEPPPARARPGPLVPAQLLQPIPAPQQSVATVVDEGCDGQSTRRIGGLRRPLRDWWQNHPPIGCWAHHNTLGCGSLQSECKFIFGSCRTFYGEPCFKGPPPSPFPPGYGSGSTECRCP
ncbi:MAG: hypothetical protein L0Z62_15270 [Gemmataceae bacterium]|nr:hypothetical protein [Gemmataceae bacterium]